MKGVDNSPFSTVSMFKFINYFDDSRKTIISFFSTQFVYSLLPLSTTLVTKTTRMEVEKSHQIMVNSYIGKQFNKG